MPSRNKVVSRIRGNPYASQWIPQGSLSSLGPKTQEREESTKISREIDEKLLDLKRVLERKKRAVQILLIGQSESGKSSILKNFHLAYAPNNFHRERDIWKTIIQLNLIGSIKMVLEILQQEWESSATVPCPRHRNLRRIRLGLSPLFFIETNLMQLIAPGNADSRDVCIRPGSNWKSILMSRRSRPLSPIGSIDGGRYSYTKPNKEIDPTSVLAASRDDIVVLWRDPSVQEVLKKWNIRMKDMPGFFLDDIERIAQIGYEPTNGDIMRARIRTMGPEEHHFIIEKGVDFGSEVYITDIGGSRGLRDKWVPYFEDVQTIVFLAPLAFNQQLEEDPRINRLENSLCLWRDVCGNKLLAHAMIILFFNKRDVLSATLDAGVSVKRYVPSYGDAPNDVNSVTKYFCDKFRSYHRKFSLIPRPFMFHETSAIDTDSMGALLMGETVRETILHINLRQGQII